MNAIISPGSAAQAPGFYRFRIGSFEAIALHDGVIVRDRPEGFVRNASDAEVGDAYASTGMARDKLTLTFTALAINTGERIVLIDTGFGEGGAPAAGMLSANLSAAGVRPEDVGTVIISHFHGDHISGLRKTDETLAFPNAEIAVPEAEWDYWMDDARMSAAPDGLKGTFTLARRIFGPNARDARRYAWGKEILPGFTAVKASGHTPGMSAIEIASGDEATMFVADITNNPLVFARHPEWQAVFDMDPQEAVSARRRLLDRAAADRLRLFFFHAPFPATGFIIKNGEGYEYVPALWSAR
ncbi:MAG: MBL fold metallo-hydrolase [Rhizobiales bacterium]|nr:MBL fold metallo-hydrolase [Hyphomicrobiales bacterium]